MERNRMASREREINVSTLVGQMNVYLAAYSRYQKAIEDNYNPDALRYVRDELITAHNQLLQDGHAQKTEDNTVVVMLPARGRVGKMVDIPRYRRFISYENRDPLAVYKFAGMRGRDEVWEESEVPLYRHEILLNNKGEGYCLLYEDLVIPYSL